MENDPTSECWCGDSVSSITGCPARSSREYYHCPKRKGLFDVEVIKNRKPVKEASWIPNTEGLR